MRSQFPGTHRSPSVIIAALLAVYLIWGSTYLGLRFGLEGFPPFLLNGFRFLIAGVILLLVLRMRGPVEVTGRQVWNAARMGMLLLVGGVGLVTIAEDLGVGSGVAATAVAIIPVWTALFSGFFGEWPRSREWIGLAVGLIGVLLLTAEGDFQASPVGMGLLLLSPVIWAFGSVWGARLDLPGSFQTTAIELISAGVVMTAVGPLIGERITEPPSTTAWLALAYLAVMGSLVAFTAYVYLLKTVRPALSTSYAYANPIVAVALGISIGAERITGPILIALPLILLGVALVATAKDQAVPEPVEDPAPGLFEGEEAA